MKITKDDLLRYEELKNYEKSIAEELDVLKANITEMMVSQGVQESEPLEAGKIVLVNLEKYTFSETVQRLEEAVKTEKAKEKANGTASVELSPYIKYQRTK